MSLETIGAIIISIFIMAVAGVSAYTGYGMLILPTIGIIIMFFVLKSVHNEDIDRSFDNPNLLKECYTRGWCSQHSDREQLIYFFLLLLVFSFIAINGGGILAPISLIILAIEFIILKRYYEKKTKIELDLRERYQTENK